MARCTPKKRKYSHLNTNYDYSSIIFKKANESCHENIAPSDFKYCPVLSTKHLISAIYHDTCLALKGPDITNRQWRKHLLTPHNYPCINIDCHLEFVQLSHRDTHIPICKGSLLLMEKHNHSHNGDDSHNDTPNTTHSNVNNSDTRITGTMSLSGPQTPSSSESDDETNNMVCYECNKSGHMTQQCPIKRVSHVTHQYPIKRVSHMTHQCPIKRVSGTCKWYDSDRGWGFLAVDDGSEDVFVHYTQIYSMGFQDLAKGEKLEFQISDNNGGKRRIAINVTGPNGDYVQGQQRHLPRNNGYDDVYHRHKYNGHRNQYNDHDRHRDRERYKSEYNKAKRYRNNGYYK